MDDWSDKEFGRFTLSVLLFGIIIGLYLSLFMVTNHMVNTRVMCHLMTRTKDYPLVYIEQTHECVLEVENGHLVPFMIVPLGQ